MSRRRSRILAFQALYSWEVTKSPLEELLTFSWVNKEETAKESEEDSDSFDRSSDDNIFAGLLIAGTIEHIEEIDKMIETYLSSNWTKDRISKIALAVLRVSAYEIVYQKDSNIKIVIDEAISIARKYGAEDSYKFINAVLDKIGKSENKAE